jgi:formate dehydrogenase iron-sulfur subunit
MSWPKRLWPRRARGVDREIVRNGSRGMVWLEPLVEVDPCGALGFGPMTLADVPGLFGDLARIPRRLAWSRICPG